jgi:hypothetical protein
MPEADDEDENDGEEDDDEDKDGAGDTSYLWLGQSGKSFVNGGQSGASERGVAGAFDGADGLASHASPDGAGAQEYADEEVIVSSEHFGVNFTALHALLYGGEAVGSRSAGPLFCFKVYIMDLCFPVDIVRRWRENNSHYWLAYEDDKGLGSPVGYRYDEELDDLDELDDEPDDELAELELDELELAELERAEIELELDELELDDDEDEDIERRLHPKRRRRRRLPPPESDRAV